jgi:hypothetical protein
MPEESPVSRTTGEFALRAVMSGVIVFVSPGPWVTMQTPIRPVARRTRPPPPRPDVHLRMTLCREQNV